MENQADNAPKDNSQVQETEQSFINVRIETPEGVAVELANVSVHESLSFVKQALVDYIETGFYTNYNFAVNGSGSVSPEFADFKSLLDLSTAESVALRIIPEIYDSKKARAHVKRIRELLTSPPSYTGKTGEAKPESADQHPSPGDKEKANYPSIEEVFRAATLKDFYSATLFRTGRADRRHILSGMMPKLLSECITGISVSAWNPPPAHRRLQGDLLYIEVVTAEEGVYHVTAAPTGFFVNKSNRHSFDPAPAAVPHFSHELFVTLLGVSGALSRSWNALAANLSIEAAPEAEKESINFGVLDGVVTQLAQGKAEKLFIASSWIVPPANIGALALAMGSEDHEIGRESAHQAHHTSDAGRAQEDLCNTFGAEDKSAPRDWNEEVQMVRAISADSPNAALVKAKYTYRVYNEFIESCKQAAVGVVEGHLSPLNPMDAEEAQVFVYNSIFFSRAIDAKETYKLCKGDEAARKACVHDVNSQRIIQSLELPGIHTVMSCVVDYKGERIICQSIIPGVLMSGVGAARLMYGAVEMGKRITCKNESMALMKELGEKLLLTERKIPAVPVTGAALGENKALQSELEAILSSNESNQISIRTDIEDEAVPIESETIPHIGPVEGKLLKGSDGRIYALEMSRLMPRDANYVRKDIGGTGLIADDRLDGVEGSLGMVYYLRHELVPSFVQWKIHAKRQEVLQTAVGDTDVTEGSEEEKQADSERRAADVAKQLQEVASECANLRFSPNCFLEVDGVDSEGEVVTKILRSDVDESVAAKDEEQARELARFLKEVVLPAVTHEVRMNSFQPYDNAALVEALHARGVNLRYLGQLAELSQRQEQDDLDMAQQNKQRVHLMPLYWLEMLEVEILSRSVKHLLNRLLNNDNIVRLAPCATITSVLNHIFSKKTTEKANAKMDQTDEVLAASTQAISAVSQGKGKRRRNKSRAVIASQSNVANGVAFVPHNNSTDCESTLQALLDLVKARYLYVPTLATIPAKSEDGSVQSFLTKRLSPLMLLRRICQVCGFRVAHREFDFTSSTPFRADDLLDIVPIVRSSTGTGTFEELPLLPNVKEMLALGRRKLQEEFVVEAFELLRDVSSMIHQVTGPLHKDYIAVSDELATVMICAGGLTSSISNAAKSVELAVQLYGPDSSEALQAHLRIASILFGIYSKYSNPEEAKEETISTEMCGKAAVDHFLTCKYIVELIGGPRHPEIANINYKLGTLYCDREDFNTGLSCLVDAKSRITDLSVQAAIAQSIAEVLFKMGHFQPALAEQKQSHKLMVEIFGEADERAVEAKAAADKYHRALTERNVKIGREIQQAQEEAILKAQEAAQKSFVVDKSDLVKEPIRDGQKRGSSKKKGSKK